MSEDLPRWSGGEGGKAGKAEAWKGGEAGEMGEPGDPGEPGEPGEAGEVLGVGRNGHGLSIDGPFLMRAKGTNFRSVF